MDVGHRGRSWFPLAQESCDCVPLMNDTDRINPALVRRSFVIGTSCTCDSAYARVADPHEIRPAAHVFDGSAAYVTHRRAQTADSADGRSRATNRDTARVLRYLRARACRRRCRLGSNDPSNPVCHRAERPMPRYALVLSTLVQFDFARRFVGAREHAADHHAVRAGRHRFGDIAGISDAAVGDHRHAGALHAFGDMRIAVICGTPTPATMRVVQIDPGPMPTFTPSAPQLTSRVPRRRLRFAADHLHVREILLAHAPRSSTPCA